MRQGLLPGPISDPTKLLWTPPTLSEPAEEAVPASGYKEFKATDTTDLKLILPASARESQTKANTVHRLQVIGGLVKLKELLGVGTMFDFRNVAASAYFEGIEFNANGLEVDMLTGGGSGASPFSYLPDVYLAACYFHNNRGSESGVHADGYQPQTALGNVYIDYCTIESEVQAYFGQPEGKPRGTLHISRTNFRYITTGTSSLSSKILYLFGPNAPAYPVKIGEDVYVQPRAGKTVGQSVEPAEGVKNAAGELIGAYTEDGGATWKFHSPYIEGSIIAGSPPEDYAVKAKAGLGYVPLGYI